MMSSIVTEASRIRQQSDLLSRVERFIMDCALEIVEREGEPIDPDIELMDLGFDSVKSVELSGYINQRYDINVSPTVFYDVHTPRTIAHYLIDTFGDVIETAHSDGVSDNDDIREGQVPSIEPITVDSPKSAAGIGHGEDIAIVGMAALMPNSEDLDKFWEQLKDGVDMVGKVPPQRWEDTFSLPTATGHRGGFMPGVDLFDAPFFHIAPKEAEQMDPQQRLFLQIAWKALEDAGIPPSSLAGSNTAVFVGVGTMDYWELTSGLEAHAATGASHAVLANRLSFFLDLRGPSEPVDTACSSSLVAVHKALQAFREEECDLAIVGGVNAMLTPSLHIALTKAGMLSPTGRCQTFDAAADGYVRGEGAAALILKPLNRALADGNPVHAIIRGSAINHGGHAASLTAPTVFAQAQVVERAWRKSGVDPNSVGYIEAHGTGTSLGDPIEINALKTAFGRLRKIWGYPEKSVTPYCGIGSVKTNIGHLEAAAGIAGLLKIVLAMKHGLIPKNLHFNTLNPYIELSDSPFFIVDSARSWPHYIDAEGRRQPANAGVSSFGFGGVNAHVVLSPPPAIEPVLKQERVGGQVFVLSARNEERLRTHAKHVSHWLGNFARTDDVSFDDVVHTSRCGREAMKCRLAILCHDLTSLQTLLSAFADGQADNSDVLIATPSDSLFKETFESCADARRWLQGETVHWPRLSGARIVSLPGYPFASFRYWPEDAIFRRIGSQDEKLGKMPATDTVVSSPAEIVTRIFSDVLGFEEIDPERSFAELGVDSILATQIHQRIAQRLKIDIPLGKMLESRNLTGLLALLDAPLSDANGISPHVSEIDSQSLVSDIYRPCPPDQYPLSQAQRQFLFLDQLSPDNPAFNLPAAVRITGPFSADRAVQAFIRLHDQHRILRTRFGIENGQAFQTYETTTHPNIEYIDLSNLLPTEQRMRMQVLLQNAAKQPLPLDRPPLCRLLIIALGDQDHVVSVCMHHIVADFSSVAMALNNIVQAGLGNAVPLETACEYMDFAWWEQHHLAEIIDRQLPYWRDRLADLPGPLPLPSDRPRSRQPRYLAATQSFILNYDTTQALNTYAQRNDVSAFVVLLAAFNCWLYRLTGRLDCIVGAPYANRIGAQQQQMIGPLAYALILRSQLSVTDTFEDVLDISKRTLYEAFDHLYVPYTRLVEELNPRRIPGCHPLFQVMLNVLSLNGMVDEIETLDIDTGYSDYDLSMRIHVQPGEIQGFLQYSTELFDSHTAQIMTESFVSLLSRVLYEPDVCIDRLHLGKRLDFTGRQTSLPERRLHIASTFTDRLLDTPLRYFGRQLQIGLEPVFCDYNQLFQALYDQESQFYRIDTNYNVVLVRAADWLRFDEQSNNERRFRLMSENLEDLTDALIALRQRTSCPLLVLILPADSRSYSGGEEDNTVYRRFVAMLNEQQGVTVIDWSAAPSEVANGDIFDAVADKAGHVPFTQAYFTAIAGGIVRWLAGFEGCADAPLWKRTLPQICSDLELFSNCSKPVERVDHAVPVTDLEQRLADAFGKVLNVESVGMNDNFFEIGGHSLSAIHLLHHVNDICHVQLTVADIFMAPTPKQLAQRLGSENGEDEQIDLHAIGRLHSDITPFQTPACPNRSDAILLTGATGFVGRFLLRELLDQTDAVIYCMTRNTDPGEMDDHIAETMKQWQLWHPGDEMRVVAVYGDLSLPDLGMDTATYRRLCRQIGAIYHNATRMNHLESFEMARAANVDAVARLLRLSSEEHDKTFNYVSTLGVFSAVGREGEFRFDEHSSIEQERHLASAGYVSSKWVGEYLVHQARARGMACNIFRLGLVTGDSEKGRYDELQSFHRLIKTCALMGTAFEGYRYDLVITPVDYVARSLAFLGQRYRKGGGIFHLSSMDITSMESVFQMYNRLVEPPLEIVPYFDWIKQVQKHYQRGNILPVVPLVQSVMNLDRAELQRLGQIRQNTTLLYDCRRTHTELESAGIVLPKFNDRLFRVYIDGIFDNNRSLRDTEMDLVPLS